ncbi:MAG: response regulator transcription factor [Cyclobacteriaceae bacterium]|nr:response regulator transcription factor [Cyclobacteriaceae bacterium]
MKILVVEDNPELANNVVTYLKEEGNVCEWVPTYSEAIDKIVGFGYEMLILDIMLPDGNGLDVIRELKKQRTDSSVLIISAKNSLDDKILGLNLGADDYLTKPFHLSELHARIKAIYRRKNLNGKQELSFNELTINIENHSLMVHNKPVDLTQKEFDLLLFFLTNKNRVITKQSIAEHLWGDYVDAYDSFDFVYQHIKNLRKKILSAGGADYIRTVYGLGYKFMVPHS